LKSETAVPAVATKRHANGKSVLVRGWRDINHSFSLVNQQQLIRMLDRPELSIAHEDMPYAFATWSPAANGAGFNPDFTQKIASIPGPDGTEPEVVLQMVSPFALYQGPAKRVVTFIVTEFGPVAEDFAPGSPAPSAFTEGRNWVVTPSNWSREKLIAAGMSGDRVAVVPHGVDGSVFRRLSDEERWLVRGQLGCQPGDFLFLNIGGAFWNKGIDLVLMAFAELRREFPRARLVLKDNRALYRRSVETIMQEVERVRPGLFTEEVIRSIVTLPGTLTMAELRLVYGSADLYVSPYRAEGFNLPVLEAMACGTRVVVTEGGATDDFFDAAMGVRIRSRFVRRSESNQPVPGDYLEPDYEDLKLRMREEILRGASGPLEVPDAFMQRWSWESATERLLEVAFKG
jgi:glycosyltransferase involved in cell wall biosynthesis